MIEMRGGAVGLSARRRGGTFILASACAVAFFALLAPGPASASYTRCHGSLAPDKGVNTDDPLAVDYTFYCNHKVHGYTITSSSPVDGFAVSPFVYQGTDPASSEVDGQITLRPGTPVKTAAPVWE